MLVTIDQATAILFRQLNNPTVYCTRLSLRSICTGVFDYRQLIHFYTTPPPIHTHTHTRHSCFFFYTGNAQHSSIVVWKCHLTRFFHLKFTDLASLNTLHNVCYMRIFVHVQICFSEIHTIYRTHF